MKKSLAWFGLGLLVASSLLGVVWAATSGDAEVRINARRLDDGRVEVGLQQRGDSVWANRQLPDARFLPPDAEAGRWLNSSPINVMAGDSADVGIVPEAQEIGFLCMVTHEQPGQEAFWNSIRQGAARVRAMIGVPIRIKAGPSVEQQAEMIRECVAEGAAGIATTLPDAAGLAAALAEAKAAGLTIVSFNSGLNDYASVGSVLHHSIDESAGGREAAARLNEHGVSGTVLCVIHEATNVGLEERCDGLEATYAGPVERFRTGALAAQDRNQAIIDRLSEGGVEAILALSVLSAFDVEIALWRSELDVPRATFGFSLGTMRRVAGGRMLFAIPDHPELQSYLASSATLLVDRLRIDPMLYFNGARMLIEPMIFGAEEMQAILDDIVADR